MSNRKLIRIRELHKEICESLQKENVITCKDVLSKNAVELLNIVHSYKASLELLHIVGKIVSPKPCTALELLQRKNSRFMSTSIPALDKILHGGITVGTITEVTGPAGCGKTQFCMMMSGVAALDNNCHGRDDSVVYIDTENAFSAVRLQEILLHKIKDIGSNIAVSDLTSRVIVFLESTFQSLENRLKSLEEIIISKKVNLIILDSIASLARKEFGHTLLNDRNQKLMKLATTLKYYAETFNIPVLVTNQITKHIQCPDLNENWEVTPALGNSWAHAVNSRLMVKVFENNVREMCLIKSPLAPPLKFYYKINHEGIVPIHR